MQGETLSRSPAGPLRAPMLAGPAPHDAIDPASQRAGLPEGPDLGVNQHEDLLDDVIHRLRCHTEAPSCRPYELEIGLIDGVEVRHVSLGAGVSGAFRLQMQVRPS